ncbi:hypothetical protein FXF51_33115 [Nonomuraea sp. PA05]|uniref:hypothetical protein n=1 Tax=Nonomuraea sp. PA05 TaxID=2604466 RepID=UPI0011DC3A83|nr:hypothetical protein [Nonomuraea sp. PA05]TYB59851.1 hypothetical protein FXF51_33115 [Nonomuraea sp. PA05]
MSKSNDLSIFLGDYGPSFVRTAYLLTGDQDRARSLAIDSLVKVCRRWTAVRANGPALVVLSELYRRFLAADVPPPATYPLGVLPPRTRAAFVARHHDALHPQQVATMTGVWTGDLDRELHQAHAHLQATHPELFPATPQPPPEEHDPGQATSSGEHHPERAAPPFEEQHPEWAAPFEEQRPEWAAPPFGEQRPEWAAPSQEHAAGPQVRDGAEPRGGLVALVTGLPATHTDVAGAVLARITRSRRIRVATWTTVSVGTMSAFVALVVAGVNSMATTFERAMTSPTSSYTPPSVEEEEAELPGLLPAKLDDPIQYAWRGYCRSEGENNANDPRPCAQWRLQTTSGNEWRLGGARAGYDEDSGVTMPLAISQDGRRIAYRQLSGRYAVRDLPTGVVKLIDVKDAQATPHLTASPNGRFFSVDFGLSDGATLDFETGVTHYEHGQEVHILGVTDDGTRAVAQQRDVSDVPGHASLTTFHLNGMRALEGGYRIDPGLIGFGGALSPDGRTLALITAESELVTMDGRTGRMGGPRTDLSDYDVITVERWVREDEVLVRSWDDDDYVALTKVNVKSGDITEVTGDWVEWLDYESPLGAVRP